MVASSEMMLHPHPHPQAVLIITAFVVFCLGFASAGNGPSLRRQASILVSLKGGFGTPNHPSLDGWELSNYKSLCSWSGVKCDDHGNFVVSIDISNLGLSGSFSPVITGLVSLRNLSVSGNNFSCPFPSQIHKIPGLQFLNISNNGFNGSLEWEFSLLQELQTLDAYNNGFEGSLPEDVVLLHKLEYLDLGGNYFSGEIPKSYGSMEGLKYLSLAGNDLNGSIPADLAKLTNLTGLRLGYYNSFDGGIPAEFGNLSNLVLLDLASCGLEGPIPPELGNLNQLDTLFLQFNQLTGTIPPRLGNLTQLKSLDISNNGLTGEIPPELSSLRSLTVLNLFMNKFHGEVPAFVADLPSLQVLQLWKNNFTGSIPSKLGQNGELVELDLSTNKLTGLVPKSLCFGRKLKILILLNNFVFGPLPDDLGRCDTLVRVRLGQNYLSGSLPIGFIYLPQLSLLELQNNYLTGLIHEANGRKQASNFTQLNLSNNQFSGPLPSSFGNLSSLKIILLSGNRFTGEIPPQIGQLKSAVKLDLSRNNFSGTIPPEIGNCLLLTSLDLSQNQLSGPIPTQITRIRVLNYLNVSSNQLSNSLPREIGSMKSLTSADFSHNNFSGMIPETGQFSLFNYTSFVGNPFLCGPSFKPCNQTPGSALETNGNRRDPKSLIRLSGKFKLVLALALFVCSLIFVVMAFIKARKWRSGGASWKLTAFQKLSFETEDILECLNDNNIIGKGGAGIVYRGITPSGDQVAVKKLLGIGSNNNKQLGSSHHDHGFSAEIQTLGNIRHRNIVRLLAFCSNKETNLLVYEYMPNGSLGEILHGKRGGHLKWDTRLKIAIEAAKGLCYLHHDCSPLIVHRDVKSNNILLDSDFEAHVADFGLAKFLNPNNGASECMSAIAGSYGYIAPEYAYTLKVDEKSDVYSFGVVLLELLTGKRPVGDFGEEGLDIVQWTKIHTNCNKEKVVNVLDERLQEVPVVEAMQVFFVAMLCVQEHSVERPTMREVVQMLAQAKQPNTFQMQ